MPLIKSASKQAVSDNIRTEMATGKYPQRQAVAIALSIARRAKRADGGLVNSAPITDALKIMGRKKYADGGAPNPPFERTEAREMVKEGPIISGVPGRTDRLPITVPANSYVMPADLLSGLPGAQGNTMAGHRILEKMFGMGPYGSSMPKEGGHWRAPPRTEFRQSRGGKVGGHEQLIPIIVAGGEFVVPPRIVAMIGGGDHKKGHEILDKFVLEVRKSHIKTLKSLPPPVKK